MRNPKKMRFDEVSDSGGDFYRQEAKAAHIRGILNCADVLNVGCWTGDFEAMILSRARTVTGIDIEPRALDVARRNVPGARFVQGSVLDLPFDTGAFDIVTFFDVVEHLPVGTETQAFSEIARVLKPGGYLAVETPFWDIRSRMMDPAYLVAGHRHYRLDVLSQMISTAGFCIERSEVCGGWIVIADYLALYTWKHIFRRPMPGSSKYQRLYVNNATTPGFVNLCLLGCRTQS